MNKTKIEWCDYTWNPVTGCYHNCQYCYARRMANRFGRTSEGKKRRLLSDTTKIEQGAIHQLHRPCFYEGINSQGNFSVNCIDPYPFGFEPTFHQYRLDEPAKVKKPSKIFVVSMGDLFGEWVPDEWIKSVFEACKKAPQHTYYFLTKNTNRYYNYFIDNPAPENWWIGASADNANKAHVRSETLNMMNANTFLSLEPLLEDVAEFIDWNGLDWVIIGAQTGPESKKPKKEWVENIISYARAYDIPVFLKDNLEWPEKIQVWPQGSEYR